MSATNIDWDALVLQPCMAAFGEVELPVYLPGAGAPVTLASSGIFNEFTTSEKLAPGTDITIQQVRPTLAFRLADLPPGAPLPCQQELVIVRGCTFKIVEPPVQDGFGQIVLTLMKVATP